MTRSSRSAPSSTSPGPASRRRRSSHAYREFFAFCRDALKTGGRLSLQTIAYSASGITLPPFIAERIFRESELPLIHEPIAAADPDFELVALRNDREHYARTLVAWERALLARREEAVAMVGEEAVTEFVRYLRVCAMAFKLDAICLLRMSFREARPGDLDPARTGSITMKLPWSSSRPGSSAANTLALPAPLPFRSWIRRPAWSS